MSNAGNPSSIQSAAVKPPAAPRRSVSARRPKGFTLIEVLAALVLLAIVLPAAMRGVAAASSAASSAQKRTKAAALASSKLQEVLATGQYENGNTSGDFGADEGPEYQGFRWEAQLSAWNQAGFNAQDLGTQTLQQLDLKVTWRGRGGDQSLILSTLVYSNAPVGPAAQPPVVTNATKRGPLLGNVTSGGF
jgi:general secretion pathway protein I